MARIFVRTVTHLDERYRPDRRDPAPLEAEERLPVYRHLQATGVMFVAEDPDPIGFSAAIVRDGVWFLSQLWVLPGRQGAGVGGALLDQALDWGSGARTFTVVASPHPAALALYLRASMYPLWLQYDVEGTVAPPIPEPPPGTDPLGDHDQPWLDELDREVHGAARSEDHALFRTEAAGLALWRDGRPRGYVYAWPGGKVGPGAVRDPGDLPDLLRAARHAAGGPISVAVPSSNWTALRELVGLGLAPATTNTFLASRPIGDASRYLSSGGALG
jgi:GNAT superfamily N-acetyltransferase